LKLIAVCISGKRYEVNFPVPFFCYTGGYEPIEGHDNRNLNRLQYLTSRYNAAVSHAIGIHRDADHLLIIDSYYVARVDEVKKLIMDYEDGSVLGASIWYWDRSHVRPRIRYYDTLSVNEFRGRAWSSLAKLPSGIISVSGVGGCWILPRSMWEASGGFFIPASEPQAGGSKGLNTGRTKAQLDCNVRLWRTHATNQDIPDYSWPKRARVSFGDWRRRFQRFLFKRE